MKKKKKTFFFKKKKKPALPKSFNIYVGVNGMQLNLGIQEYQLTILDFVPNQQRNFSS